MSPQRSLTCLIAVQSTGVVAHGERAASSLPPRSAPAAPSAWRSRNRRRRCIAPARDACRRSRLRRAAANTRLPGRRNARSHEPARLGSRDPRERSAGTRDQALDGSLRNRFGRFRRPREWFARDADEQASLRQFVRLRQARVLSARLTSSSPSFRRSVADGPIRPRALTQELLLSAVRAEFHPMRQRRLHPSSPQRPHHRCADKLQASSAKRSRIASASAIAGRNNSTDRRPDGDCIDDRDLRDRRRIGPSAQSETEFGVRLAVNACCERCSCMGERA